MPDITFLDSLINSQVGATAIISSMFSSCILGMIIALIYKKTNQGFSYDSSFVFTLVMITMIVNAIMTTIGSNIALSLGLIGSLSIIRFRTAIKNTMDMGFLFWSIATGLAIGAHQYLIAVIVVIFVAAIILLFNKSKLFFKANTDYIVTINLNNSKDGEEIAKMLTAHQLKWQVKSSFFNKDGGEITYSIYSKKTLNIDKLLADINNCNFVKNVALLSPSTNLFI